MIGQLRGTLSHKGAERLIIDVGGVGYELTCPLTTLERLPAAGEQCVVSVKTYVREDQITLFGFSSLEERRLFEALTTVSGIGPRLAVACLSGLDAEALKVAIITGDARRISSVPGIGRKTADRMILELRAKLEKHFPLEAARPEAASQLSDLQSALLNLGYKPKDVDDYLSEVRPRAAELTFEELLKGALARFAF
ncbi:MAG: Holliday junction branch migration protein RuvA [Deltaproteobacteria bacterium]|nr:Holliday junction branch migration protein RuvA [Deltaproteobacteria bacterium]